MVVDNTMDALAWLRKQLDGDENDLLREMVREFAQRLMAAEVDVLAGAGWGEVSVERTNYRNGYRQRPFDTRVGTIELAIPKLRRATLPGLAPRPAAGGPRRRWLRWWPSATSGGSRPDGLMGS